MTRQVDRISRAINQWFNQRYGEEWVAIFDTWTGGVLALLVLAVWEFFEKSVLTAFCEQSYLVISGCLKVLFFALIALLFVYLRLGLNRVRHTKRQRRDHRGEVRHGV